MNVGIKKVLFYLLFFVLMLSVLVISLEVAVPMIFGMWWSSVNLAGNPDHRMTQEQYTDVNSDGIRCAFEPDYFKEEDFNIIVLGDSFVYGMWLGRQDTIPFRLEQIARAAGYTHVNVINYGWISSSPYLSLRLLRDIGKKYKPDLVIDVVDMTDFWDDTFYRRVVERKGFFSVARWMPATSFFLGKWGHDFIRQDWYAKNLWGVPWQRYFAMERPLAETRPYMDALVRNLDDINHYAGQELDAPFIAFVMPRSVQYSEKETPEDTSDEYTRLGPYSQEPFRYVAEVAPQRSYPLISLLDDFKNSTVYPLTMPNDPHLTSAGNKEGAAFIWRHLQRSGLLPPSDSTPSLP